MKQGLSQRIVTWIYYHLIVDSPRDYHIFDHAPILLLDRPLKMSYKNHDYSPS